MDSDSRLPWIIVLVLLFTAAYFAVAETAIASCSRNRIKMADDRGNARARKALYILDNFDTAITTLLICSNITHLSIAAIVTVAVTRRWGLSAVTAGTLLTTLAVFFAGEMLPKSIAKKYSEKFTLSCSPVVCAFMKLFRPLSWILEKIGVAAASLTKGDPEISVTEDELYDIIEDMTEEGTLDEEQGDLISSALQFGELTAESILTPRVALEAIDVEAPLEDILSQIKSQNHSRLPVYEGTIDNIIGVLQIRKFIKAYLHDGAALQIRPLLDETIFVHQSAKIDELLSTLSKRKMNMAVVADNYGGTLGIVTVEDILEELVGEIWDEDDVVEEAYTKISDTLYVIDAGERVSDVFELFGYEDPEGDEELVDTTLGEWAYEQFSTIPRPGESFVYHRLKITVASMDHNRILRLDAALMPEEKEASEE